MVKSLTIVAMWLLLALLVLYVWLTRKGGKLYLHTDFIRKIWYLSYLLGVVLFLSVDPKSLLIDWEKYLIVLGVFIVIDSLFFLELYFGKFWGQELKSTKEQIDVTQNQLSAFIRTTREVRSTLTQYEFPMYYKSKEQYFLYMKELFKKYEKESGLLINLYQYNTVEEINELLDGLGTAKSRVKRSLKGQNSITLKKDSLGLYPFNYFNSNFIVQVESPKNKDITITEAHGEAISILFVAFDLSVQNKIKESGENGGNQH